MLKDKKINIIISLAINICIFIFTILASIIMFTGFKFMHGTDIVLESNIDVEEHLDSIKILKENLKEKDNSQEVQQMIFDTINENIDHTLAKWEKRYYYR